MPSYVLELLFDPDSETTIRNIWRRISEADLPSSLDAEGYRPHLTLAVSDAIRLDIDRCQERLTQFARAQSSFPITLNHLGLFQTRDNVVFLGVVPSQNLLNLHRVAFGLCQQFTGGWRDYYAPDHWTPHVTLAFNLTPMQAVDILKMAWEIALPIQARAYALQIVELTPTHARDLVCCELEQT